MATITLDIPDAVVPRVLNAVAGSFGFDPNGSPTKAQFAKQHMADYLREITINYEANLAASNAADAARDAAEAEIQIS